MELKTAESASGSTTSSSSYTSPSCSGDYDNDGWPDLFARDPSTYSSPISLMHNEGNSRFVNRAETLPLETITANAGGIWGDCDNDVDLDLYVAWGSPILILAGRDILLRNDI